MKSETTQTFSELMREGNRYTDRDFMKALSMGHPKLKACEANPALFSVAELVLLAELIGRPARDVIKVVLAEADRNPKVAEQREEAKEQVVGRKYYPRKPKAPVPPAE